jgi:mono/diheme cytochrome c family protein
MRRWLGYGVAALVGLFVLIQLVPYGRAHTNPPVKQEPTWDTPQARELAVRACYDCHSNETTWPWYSNVAPFSWLVQSDVDEARHALNFSRFDRRQKHAVHAAEELSEGDMPLWFYVPLHPSARLTDAEREQLAASFRTMFGTDEGEEGEEEEGER